MDIAEALHDKMRQNVTFEAKTAEVRGVDMPTSWRKQRQVRSDDMS
jgi:hypothetical protein